MDMYFPFTFGFLHEENKSQLYAKWLFQRKNKNNSLFSSEIIEEFSFKN